MWDIESLALSVPIAVLSPFPVGLVLTPPLTGLRRRVAAILALRYTEGQGSDRKSIERMSGCAPWRRLGGWFARTPERYELSSPLQYSVGYFVTI
jgi:hypothetical protein